MLNKLQSNRSVLNAAEVLNSNPNINLENKLELVNKHLLRSGVTKNDLSTLPVLHVSGTKGKGSTCAYCESILRHHGYKTGFFSSPHLMEARERIRINGIPILKETFAKFFWDVFKNLDEQKDNPSDMAFYFQFLFIMAVNIFLKERVDIAIIEVGIGGEYDTTNVVTNVPVAGITSLGFDHTSILGNTIESIAWNKGGIMKKGSQVFTVTQPSQAYEVLHARSIERQCTLTVVENACHLPYINKYPCPIRTNINLAIEMSKAWMQLRPKQPNNGTLLNMDLVQYAIENCVWLGRYQIKEKNSIRFYIDGAHTKESIMLCVDWYLNDIKNRVGKRALIFNLTGQRSVDEFFHLLKECQFETVIFVPNLDKPSSENAGQQVLRCHTYKQKWLDMRSEGNVEVFGSVLEAVEYLEDRGAHNVLLTGSLHLVGAALSLLLNC